MIVLPLVRHHALLDPACIGLGLFESGFGCTATTELGRVQNDLLLMQP